MYQFSAIMVGIALLSGVVGTTFYYRGIHGTPASQATIFELSFPLTGVLLDIFVTHKMPDIIQIIAGVLLIGSMVAIARGQKKL